MTRVGRLSTIDLSVIDQSHLDGVLVLLRDHGTSLISVEPLASDEEG